MGLATNNYLVFFHVLTSFSHRQKLADISGHLEPHSNDTNETHETGNEIARTHYDSLLHTDPPLCLLHWDLVGVHGPGHHVLWPSEVDVVQIARRKL